MATGKDLIVMTGILLTMGMLLFIVNFSAKTMVDTIVDIPQINTSQTAIDTFEDINTSTGRFDYLFLGVFIGLILVSIIVGWFTGGEPIFMVLYFIVAVIAVIGSMIMANVWGDLSQASVFGTTVNSFPITNHILSNLPVYITVIAVIGIVVMFSRAFLRRGL